MALCSPHRPKKACHRLSKCVQKHVSQTTAAPTAVSECFTALVFMNILSWWCARFLCLSVILMTFPLQAQIGKEWQLRQPLPTAEALNGVVSTGTLLVAVGDAGTIVTSS